MGSSRTWVARVGRRLSPTADAVHEPDAQRLTALAEQAADAARQSARHATAAAHASGLAALTVDRLGTAPIEQARSTSREIAGSAEQATTSSAAARDQAALVSHAVQCEVDRGAEQPVRPPSREET